MDEFRQPAELVSLRLKPDDEFDQEAGQAGDDFLRNDIGVVGAKPLPLLVVNSSCSLSRRRAAYPPAGTAV